MTKEEIANIKRIDTSLNVFKKKIKALEEKKRKLLDPIITEMMALEEEINFWQKPVIERYGKTTEELLTEAGEQTAEEISTEEDKETIPSVNETSDDPLETALKEGKDVSTEETTGTNVSEPVSTDASNESGETEWPEEWN